MIMKPIHKLKLSDKISILYELYPASIVDFTEYLKATAMEAMEDGEEITKNWEKDVVPQTYWMSLARKTSDRIELYGESFFFSRKLFIRELFEGGVSLFTVHALLKYAKTENCSPKFALAVKLFIEI